VTGAQAMVFTNPSQVFHIKAGNPNLDFGVTVPPYGPRDTSGKSFINGGWGYSMPTGVKHANESWLLIDWLCATTEAAGWFMIQQLRPSPMKAVNQDRAYLDKLPTVWPELLQVLSKDVPVPITPVDGDISKILGQMLTEAAANKGSATDLVHQAATQSQQQLDMFWAKHTS
jgi:ABC-type glycerol-3-phosphate transport system substrate-binding protein